MSETQVKSRGRGREMKVGIFVILGIGAVLTALFTLTDAAMFRGRYIITTLVPNAGGIRKGDAVQMRGVNIGRIQKFRIANDGVTVSLEVEGEYKIPTDSRVELKSLGVLGGMVADVVPGTASTVIHGGDTLPGGMAAGVFDQMGKLADQSHDVLARVQTMLSDKTVSNVESSTTELNAALKDMAEITKRQKVEMAALVDSLRKTAGSVEKATSGPELEASVKRLDVITRNMDAVSASFERTSKSSEAILARMERGEGTLGRLSKDETLYVNANEAVVNLNKTIQEMKLLTEDIRKQPRRYLKLSFF